MKKLWLLFLACAGCTSQTAWKFDILETGNEQFECAKLLYANPKSASPLRFEMTRIGYEIASYLNLQQYRFSSHSTTSVALTYGDETYEEEVPILEGKMRLRLSPKMTEILVGALQQGKAVKISLDGFEETLQSESFNPLYQKLVKNSQFLQNILKGSTEWTIN